MARQAEAFGFIVQNGRLVEIADARIDPMDRGLLLGDGVFDTMLAVDGACQFATEHFNRLARHAAAIHLPLAQDAAALEALVVELLEANYLNYGRTAIRTTLTRGSGPRGLKPPEIVQPTLLMQAADAMAVKPTVTAIIAGGVRRNEGSPLSRIKSLNAGDQIMALREAMEAGADDAILLNNRGQVCCSTVGNVFVMKGGQWLTPPLTDGVMDGVTRGRIIGAGLAAQRSLTEGDLRDAEMVVVTNSITGARQVMRIEDRVFEEMPREVAKLNI